jgi:hypothetical protein
MGNRDDRRLVLEKNTCFLGSVTENSSISVVVGFYMGRRGHVWVGSAGLLMNKV